MILPSAQGGLLILALLAVTQISLSFMQEKANDKTLNRTFVNDAVRPAENETLGDISPAENAQAKMESWISILGLAFLLGILAIAVVIKMVQSCGDKTKQNASKNNKQKGGQLNIWHSKKARDLCRLYKVWNYPGPPSFSETISVPSSSDVSSVGNLSSCLLPKSAPQKLDGDQKVTIEASAQKKNGEKHLPLQAAPPELMRCEKAPLNTVKKKDDVLATSSNAPKPAKRRKQGETNEICRTPQTSMREGSDSSTSKTDKKQP
uniref:Uncharacterized protein n=1 Tax=Trichuris muris TaxID=70415 RepID=A0A5S6QCB6_TRIMR